MRTVRWTKTRTAGAVGAVVVVLAATFGIASDSARQDLEGLLLRSPLSRDITDQAGGQSDFVVNRERRNFDGTEGAGGRAVAHHAGGVPIDDPDILDAAPDARLYRLGHNAWEPSIGVNDEGHVFFQARTPELQPEVMRSTDEGHTWEIVSPTIGDAPAQPISVDPFLYLDTDTGRVFTTNISPTITCPPVSFTDDGGESWTNSSICGHFDHQNIFSGPPVTSEPIDYPNVVYFCAINLVMLAGSSTATTCSKSIDGGLTWVPTGEPAFLTPMPPRQDQDGLICNGAIGHGYVDRDGTVFLPRVWCGEPTLSISRDEGLTWEQITVSDIAGAAHEASVVTDSQDNIYFTWIGEDRLPYLAISRDDGETWGEPMMIASPGVHRTSLPKMDIGDDGKIVVAYVGTDTDSDTPDNWLWNAYMTMSVDALADNPVFYTGTANDPADPVTIGNCGALRCTTLGDFFDVKIGPDGTPWASFVDGCNGPEDCITTFNAIGDRGEGIVGRLVGLPLLDDIGPPVAAIDAPSRVRAGEVATFDGSGSHVPDGEIVSWEWDMDDGTVLEGEVVQHAYERPGRRTVVLTVTSDDGATATATHSLTVQGPPARSGS